jgi:hypothetical protein
LQRAELVEVPAEAVDLDLLGEKEEGKGGEGP